jgi:gliding motility-associated-like protein
MTRRVFLILICCFGIVWCADAQYGSRLGRFQVDEVKGCAPFTVTVTIVAPFVCDAANPCDMDFEGNNSFKSLTFTHTYTQPGTYLLRILFQTSGFDDIPIEVTPNVPPVFDLFTCRNNEISVQLKDSNYDEYVINFNDATPEIAVSGTAIQNHAYGSSSAQTVTVRGRNLNAADNCASAGTIITPLASLPAPTITNLQVLDDNSIRLAFNALPNIQYKLGIATNNATTFQQAKTIYNTNVDTVLNLRTEDNYYCFQLAAYDPCNNQVINSTTICSPNLDLAVRNGAIDVAWATSTTGVSSNRLARTASDGTTLATSPTGSPYTDSGIICGTEYCYQLTMNYPNGSQSVSLIKCGTGFSTDTPTPISNITAMVQEESVLLEWQSDPEFVPAEFSIDKSVNGDYSFLSTTTQNAFSDPEYTIEEAVCYRIRYTDVCGNQSPYSPEVCPILLTGTLRNDNSISLTWTAYEGWANGVSAYSVDKYTEDGALLQTFQVGTATSYIDQSDDVNYQTFVYVIRASAVEPGLGQAISNRVPIMKDPNLFHPTAFTPNGDNLNDNFSVFGQYVVGFEMQIFNRWGELLFSTTDIQSGWDGTYRGTDMPEGTYTFIAHITDRAGRTFKRSGSVLLLRRD